MRFQLVVFLALSLSLVTGTADARTPPRLRETKIGRIASALVHSFRSLVVRQAAARPMAAPTRRTSVEEAFRRGDVYLDYSFEGVQFRWEKQTQKVFRRFYGQAEVQISHTSNMYHDAISAGKQITRKEYFSSTLKTLGSTLR
jgi:hypothetical protein